MAADPVSRLRKIRARGSMILRELTRGSDAVAAERAWVPDLLLAVAPWGELEQGRYEPLNAFDDDEKAFVQDHLNKATVELVQVVLDDDHFHAIQSHAVRMHRLEGLFKRIGSAAPAKPRGKGGRPKHRHPELVKAVQKELLAQVARGDKLVMAKAFEAALDPLGLDGDKYERLVRWLYDQEWDLAALGKPVSRIK